MGTPYAFGDYISAPGPDEQIPTRVPGHDVPRVRESQTGDIFRFVPGIENPLLLHHTVPVFIGPEGYVAFATGYECVPVQWVELHGYYRVSATLYCVNYQIN